MCHVLLNLKNSGVPRWLGQRKTDLGSSQNAGGKSNKKIFCEKCILADDLFPK